MVTEGDQGRTSQDQDPDQGRSQTRASSMFKPLIGLSILIGLVCVVLGLTKSNDVYSLTDEDREQQDQRYHRYKDILDLTYMPEEPIDTKNRTKIGQENATMFMLVRNRELQDALASIREIEDRFNRRFRYPWTFLNDEEFTDEFKSLTRGMVSGEVEYGFVDSDMWGIPDYIDRDLMETKMHEMEENQVIYGGSLSYRLMCRFNSGFFFRHPTVLKYDYYWRVEPNVHFYCDQLYDPFTFMRVNNKVYGFVIAIFDYIDTIPTLWQTAKQFFNSHNDYLAPDNALDFVTDQTQLRKDDYLPDSEDEYNLCHFWSNFEIANLNFFRSKEYVEFFEHLDRSGGFFYERWGDAPVHTLGLTALLNRSQIHHFSDMGYKHEPYHRCPADDASYLSGRCLCPLKKGDEVDLQPFSCLPKWWYHSGRQFLFNMTNVGHGEEFRI